MMSHFWGKKIWVGVCLIWLGLGFMAMPAAAQGPGGPAITMEKPQAPAEEKKDGPPSTCGPIISDTCLPIETGHFAMQVFWALSFYRANFTPSWRQVSAKGNFYTFNMPVKFTYGPTKDMEVYVVVPFISQWCNSLSPDLAGPNGERTASYSGIGDMTLIGKYNLLPEEGWRPAVTAVAGFATIPTGHASNLNPGRLGQDAIGTGSLSFTGGVNLFKYLKPFLVNSQIWYNAPVNIYKIHGTDTPAPVRNTDWVTFNLATEYPFTADKKWVLLMEMYSNWTWTNPKGTVGFQTPTTLLGLQPALEFVATDKLSLAAGCAFDLVGKYGGTKITPVVTALYSF
ncbi:MAG: transporter family protein [Desulfobaccales bacterium]